MGAGHTVTALYEIVPPGAKVDVPGVDPLKYQQPAEPAPAAGNGELLTIKVRYKEPKEEASRLLSQPVKDAGLAFEKAPDDFRFAAAAAEFGMLLRASPFMGSSSYGEVARIAEGSLGLDGRGHRAEFLRLVRKARSLNNERPFEPR